MDRVFREYHENGGLLKIESLLERQRDLPWYLRETTNETTGSKQDS